MYKTLVGLLVAGSLLQAEVALAHHSFAMFDNKKQIVVTGTVTDFQWTNPHTWIELNVIDQQGKMQHWSIEGGSVLALSREGWNSHVMKPGDKITLSANPLRSGMPGGSLLGVTLANGKHLGSAVIRGTVAPG